MRTTAAAFTAALLSISTPPGAATQQTQPPTFRSAVDLLTLQVSVLGKDGRPVADLQPSDFEVTVEGKARKVLFARYRGDAATTTEGGGPPGVAPIAAGHSENTRTASGRLVMFVVDRDSMRTGSEKALLESSSTILDALSPADAVGLLSIPVGGVDPTRDHTRVREELKRISGTQPSPIGGPRDRNLTWDEALAFERSDASTISRVVERECSPTNNPNRTNTCPQDLEVQARNMLAAGRGHARTVLQALEGTLKALTPVRGPKHVVLLSGGQPFDPEILPHYNDFARAAAAARITLHAVHVDQPDSDVSDRRISTSAFGGRDMATGLTTMTGMTGGGYYSGVGRAVGVFERIRLEIANDYELGLETLPSDADGRLHDLSVRVKRPDVTIRTRKQVLLAKSDTAASKDAILSLLNQPTDVADIPMAVASYTTRGEEPTTLRVLLSAEIGAGDAGEWAFAVFDRNKVVADGRQDLEAAPGRRTLTTSLQLAPGRYRIRVAALAADGRAGLVDAPLGVGLRAAGPLQLSDVIVGTALSGRVQPQSRIVAGQRLAALLEVLSADPAALEKARVAMEIIPAGATEPARRLLMALRGGASSAIVLSEAQIDTATLAPGRYTASAIALVDTQPVGRVSRTFELVTEPAK